MFPQFTQSDKKPTSTKKQFLTFDKKNNWLWWQEETTLLFHPAEQVTEIKLVPTTDNSLNIYARIDLKDRFEYKLIDNKKTFAAAKKVAEEFVAILKSKTLDNIETLKDPSVPNAIEALIDLKKELNKK